MVKKFEVKKNNFLNFFNNFIENNILIIFININYK